MGLSKSDEAEFDKVKRQFPLLAVEGAELTSPVNPRYNCIAWAAGDMGRWWWPLGKYWPGDVPRAVTVVAFVEAYQRQGFVACGSRDFEIGYEKIALYVDSKYEVLHAAKQLPDGKWSSKMGSSVDISHTLTGLEGNTYGRVAQILRRKIE